MTRLFVNDREIAPPLEISSLDQILKFVEGSHLPPNSVVKKVQIDGTPVTPDSLSSNAWSEAMGPNDLEGRIEIFTGTVAEIAHESLDEARDYLNRVEAAIPSLITSFQTSPDQDAYGSLKQLYEGFYWLNLLLDKLNANFQVNLENALIQEISVAEYHHKFASILKQLIEAQEKRDFVLISDLLEYEILPLVPVWKEMFAIVLKRMSTAQ
jgi:hypothetical protein